MLAVSWMKYGHLLACELIQARTGPFSLCDNPIMGTASIKNPHQATLELARHNVGGLDLFAMTWAVSG